MKLFVLALTIIASFSASAAWNEVECDGRIGSRFIQVEVEQAFPQGSYFSRAQVTVSENGGYRSEHYTVSRRPIGPGRIEYSAGGLRLEVDIWPDRRPRWGWNYRGLIQSTLLGDRLTQSVNCRFPNAR